MIEAIVCDFGGVLTTPLAGSFAAFAAQSDIPAQALNLALTAIAERDGAHPLHELETGRLSEADFFGAIEAELTRRFERETSLASFSDVYWQNLSPNHELIDLLLTLTGRLRLALLTNNVREWEPRWRAMLPVEQIFEFVIDSSAVGLRKPDPAIYALTLQRLALPPAACLFIDDYAENCAAAAAAGMQTVHFRDNAQAIAEIERALSAH